ncbi:MAG: hypothetical protein GW859_00240 [Sphingomonadales bacterium]|nr:hypothetical protein [Sphingomonadales bacterium]
MIRAVLVALALAPSLAGCDEQPSDNEQVDAVAQKISDDADALVAQRSAEAAARGNEAVAATGE